MKVAVLGLGYVGLVSGVCFADAGHDVIGFDLDMFRVLKLRDGEVPIFEPKLEPLMKEVIKSGKLTFDISMKRPVEVADVVVIAVGTPEGADGSADLRYVFAAAKLLAPLLQGPTTIVVKSTVPIGTGDKVEAIIKDTNKDADIDVVSNPEFLREGVAVDDFTKPDRVIVGTNSDRAKKAMEALYAPFMDKKKASQ